MGEDAGRHLMYADLAGWWPLLSPVEEYAEEVAFLAGVIADAAIPVREVLELGSGGGHCAAHLSGRFTMTLVDASEEMLAVSRALNPECEHVVGDMRTVRFDRPFDAVFVHDAIDYMATEADLAAAIATAWVHCTPGGRVVLVPDHVADTFRPSSDGGGTDAANGRGIRYLEWTWDPDPTDAQVLTEYAYLIREADGAVRSFHETHVTGLFPRAHWLAALAAAGFEPQIVTEETDEDRPGREIFVGDRPAV